MNAKQFRITSDTLSPLYKATVGFDRLFNEFENIHSAVNSQGYPPYNISKSLDDDEVYVITLAVAGFKKADLNVELKDHVLTIKGERDRRRPEEDYVHRGLSTRKFSKSYRLSEYTEVVGADLNDGILTVNLEVIVPKEKLPKAITIK